MAYSLNARPAKGDKCFNFFFVGCAALSVAFPQSLPSWRPSRSHSRPFCSPRSVLADDPADRNASVLYAIAQDTWKFYATDLDPNTHLPMDNLTWVGQWPTQEYWQTYT